MPALSLFRFSSQASPSLLSVFCSSNSSFLLPHIFVLHVQTSSSKFPPPSPYSPGKSPLSSSSSVNPRNRAKTGHSCLLILPSISPLSTTPAPTAGGQLLG